MLSLASSKKTQEGFRVGVLAALNFINSKINKDSVISDINTLLSNSDAIMKTVVDTVEFKQSTRKISALTVFKQDRLNIEKEKCISGGNTWSIDQRSKFKDVIKTEWDTLSPEEKKVWEDKALNYVSKTDGVKANIVVKPAEGKKRGRKLGSQSAFNCFQMAFKLKNSITKQLGETAEQYASRKSDYTALRKSIWEKIKANQPVEGYNDLAFYTNQANGHTQGNNVNIVNANANVNVNVNVNVVKDSDNDNDEDDSNDDSDGEEVKKVDEKDVKLVSVDDIFNKFLEYQKTLITGKGKVWDETKHPEKAKNAFKTNYDTYEKQMELYKQLI
jgi:hypothetical protein